MYLVSTVIPAKAGIQYFDPQTLDPRLNHSGMTNGTVNKYHGMPCPYLD